MAFVALLVFGYRLPAEPHFVDESAYYSQSYFASLFGEGRWDDPAWVDYPAYDLRPLPKYLIGVALGLGGYRLPGPAEARSWYADTSSRFEAPGGLTVARLPFVVVGAIGCVAVYGLGCLAAGRGVGLTAALILVANPLYRLLSRRAMSDVPCEAFLNVGLFFALWAWKSTVSGRSWGRVLAGATGAGVGAALSLLSKLSGMLFLFILASWLVLALVSGDSLARKWWFAGVGLLVSVVAVLLFVVLDPYLTANPRRPLVGEAAAIRDLGIVDRARLMFRLRFRVSSDQQSLFRHNALLTPIERGSAVAVQGFGRFGPLGPSHSDSTRRFDPYQDWGGVVWLPIVLGGLVWSYRLGWRQFRTGEPPTGWALLAQFGVALAVVIAYIPMAWDRYFLPIQAPSALLAGGAAVSAINRVAKLIRREPVLAGVDG